MPIFPSFLSFRQDSNKFGHFPEIYFNQISQRIRTETCSCRWCFKMFSDNFNVYVCKKVWEKSHSPEKFGKLDPLVSPYFSNIKTFLVDCETRTHVTINISTARNPHLPLGQVAVGTFMKSWKTFGRSGVLKKIQTKRRNYGRSFLTKIADW